MYIELGILTEVNIAAGENVSLIECRTVRVVSVEIGKGLHC